MILVDTSVWIDHLRAGDQTLVGLLGAGRVLAHPLMIGEIALGHLRERKVVLGTLSDRPHDSIATDAEVLHFIDHYALSGRGIGYVDAHLLAAVRLTAGASPWTRDTRLHSVAEPLGLGTMLPEQPTPW